MYDSKKLQKGRSMIEMIAVLAIIGIVTVGAIAGINQGLVKYRTSKTYAEVKAIAQGFREMYSYRRWYPTGLLTKNTTEMRNACKSDVFPSGCDDDLSNAFNPFGGFYTVQSSLYGDDGRVYNCYTEGQECSILQVFVTQIPEDACDELSEMDWGRYAIGEGECSKMSGAAEGMYQFKINFE